MTTDATVTAKHMVHAINADTGAEPSGWPVDLNAMAKSGSTTFNSLWQNQRAALTFLGGKVFIPFSGHVGDCDGYHGWMVGVTSSGTVSAWATKAIAGGIWGSTGAASDGTSLFFATGNSKSSAGAGPNSSSGDSDPTNWGDSETVYKFPTSLVSPAMTTPGTTTDYFVPSNWVAQDDADADMGGTSPNLGQRSRRHAVGVGGGAGQGQVRLPAEQSQPGRDGRDAAGEDPGVDRRHHQRRRRLHHLERDDLRRLPGVGLELPERQLGRARRAQITAANPPTISTAWCGGPTGSGSPAVTQTDTSGSNTIVWSVGSDNKLPRRRRRHREQRVRRGGDGDVGGNTIQTPIVANGRIFVASNSQVYAWKP